jgi:hypothetical protein
MTPCATRLRARSAPSPPITTGTDQERLDAGDIDLLLRGDLDGERSSGTGFRFNGTVPLRTSFSRYQYVDTMSTY